MVGHGKAVAAIGRVLVGAEQVAGGRQAEPPGGAAGQNHRLAFTIRNSEVRVLTAIAPAMRPSASLRRRVAM